MKIVAPIHIWDKIAEFYINAKNEAHKHAYGWDEVFRDIDLACSDTNFTPCKAANQSWINQGYQTVVNKRGWVFAYTITNGTMHIYDVENSKNITKLANTSNVNLDLLKNLSSVKSKQQKPYSSLGFGWWAIRHDDGYVYIHYKNGYLMPNIRFNEIIKPFRKRKDDNNVYAIGEYGGKNFKFYLNGKCIMMENRNTIRLTEAQFKRILTECITKIINEIA